MRNHFIDTITDIAKQDSRIMLLNADLGFSVIEKFEQLFPNRCVNIGIAEQNLAAISAGLALEGNMVFTYSIGNFPTLRCIEQLRNDVCYHKANVKITAVGGGFAYGSLGMTHHATEDIAMMRALPNMKVYAPCDYVSAVAIAKEVCKNNDPCYIRMERGKEPLVFPEDTVINVNKIQNLIKGNRIAILAVGTVVREAIKASEIFDNEISVYSVLTLKPIDKEAIEEIANNHEYIITLEEHNIIGGLGSIVAEIIATEGLANKLVRLGLNEEYTSEVGSQEYLREVYGLDCNSIVECIKDLK